MSAKTIVILIIIALTLLFILQNTQKFELHFLFWTLTMSGAAMIFIVTAIGAILGILLYNVARHTRKKI